MISFPVLINNPAVYVDKKSGQKAPENGFNQDIDTVFYKVSMAANPNISDSSMMVSYVNKPVSIEGSMTDMGIKLYPNPTRGELAVSMEGQAGPVDITLHDVTGKQVFGVVGARLSGGPYQLRLESLEDGYYYVSIRREDGTHTVLPVILHK